MKTWRAIVLIPVWLITLVTKPFFPPNHPWRTQKLTLRSWAEYGTPIAMEFGYIFWGFFLCGVFIAVRLATFDR